MLKTKSRAIFVWFSVYFGNYWRAKAPVGPPPIVPGVIKLRNSGNKRRGNHFFQ